MRFFYLFWILFFVACGGNSNTEFTAVWACTCDEQSAAAKWVGDHIEDANNRSDEEMEDVISQLQKTAIQLHCKRKMKHVSVNNSGTIVGVPNDSCLIIYNY